MLVTNNNECSYQEEISNLVVLKQESAAEHHRSYRAEYKDTLL